MTSLLTMTVIPQTVLSPCHRTVDHTPRLTTDTRQFLQYVPSHKNTTAQLCTVIRSTVSVSYEFKSGDSVSWLSGLSYFQKKIILCCKPTVSVKVPMFSLPEYSIVVIDVSSTLKVRLRRVSRQAGWQFIRLCILVKHKHTHINVMSVTISYEAVGTYTEKIAQTVY